MNSVFWRCLRQPAQTWRPCNQTPPAPPRLSTWHHPHWTQRPNPSTPQPLAPMSRWRQQSTQPQPQQQVCHCISNVHNPGYITTASSLCPFWILPATAEGQANALLELTRDVSKLNSSQVDQLVSQLENLLSGPNVSLALGNTSVQIVSNLLDASSETLANSASRLHIYLFDILNWCRNETV